MNIEDVETIQPYAFEECDIETLHWPPKCKTIPRLCFAKSEIKQIVNLADVTVVEEFAFAESGVMTLRWPDNCEVIPNNCFLASGLKKISNVHKVSYIGEQAFQDVKPLEKIDFSDCSIIDIGQCAFKGVSERMIDLPYYISAEQAARAFDHCS